MTKSIQKIPLCGQTLIRLDDLGKKLDLGINLSLISDEEIILRAYLKWGKDMVHHLEGDWAFAIWDRVEEQLFLARAAHGDGAIFYHYSGNMFFFSSLLTGLVGIDGIPNELDKEKLFMECFSASGFQTRTLYKNIHFLQPGHCMTVSKDRLQLTQYWRPLEFPKVNFKKDEEYFEAFHEAYDRAVRDRLDLDDKWGFAISGGLDSAATMGVASTYFKERSKTAEAMCFVPTYRSEAERTSPMQEGDESHVAQEIADFNGNVNLNLVTKDVPWWEFMTTYTRDFGTPPHMAGVYFANALADAAGRKNLGKVIIGQGGNQGLSFEGVSSYIDLKQYQSDLKRGLDKKINKLETNRLLLKSTYSSGLKTIKRLAGHQRIRVADILEKNTLLSQEFVKSINGYELLEEHYFGKDKQLTSGEFKFNKRLKPGKHCRLGLWNQLGTRYDVVFVDPCRDKRFLELAISFPNHIFNRNGEGKFLFKQTFKSIIPSGVMSYKKKGINLSDLSYRYRLGLGDLKSLIESKQNDDLFNEIIDSKKLKSFYERLGKEVDLSTSYTQELYNKSPSLFHGLLT